MKTPLLMPWQITILQKLLLQDYQVCLKRTGLDKVFKCIAHEKGLIKAKEAEAEYRENVFTDLGKIWHTIKKLDEISASYVDEVC